MHNSRKLGGASLVIEDSIGVGGNIVGTLLTSISRACDTVKGSCFPHRPSGKLRETGPNAAGSNYAQSTVF